MQVDEQLAERTLGGPRKALRGTRVGELCGSAPTGNQVGSALIDMFGFRDGPLVKPGRP